MSYSRARVKGLVDGYAVLRERRDTAPGAPLEALITFADITRAIASLPLLEYQAVLLHGLLRHTVRDAAPLLGIGRSTLHERYESGLSWLTDYLNGANE